jgi:hypothetical protein
VPRFPSASPHRFGWKRPRWRDSAFWVAVALTAALIGVQLAVLGWSGDWWWVSILIRGVLTWFVISACLRIRIGIGRGLIGGFNDAEQAARARPTGQSRGEAVAKTGGRMLGKALGAAKRAPR